MLEISDVRLTGTDGEAFDHAFHPGQVTVVLGANRSGKTDLCRLIAGLPTVATGRVSVHGTDLAHTGPRQRPVSMVYQAFINYPNLTVFENIASPLRARRMAASEVETRVSDVAARLGLSELLGRMPQALSGGQQQRVAIARALAREAPVVLLDEPLVNLDFKLREALEVELRDVLAGSDTIVIYTSSDPRDAFIMADQLLLLEQGRKVQAGTPMQVYQAPASLPAMALLSEPQVNRLSTPDGAAYLRPEHVHVMTGGAQSDDNDMQFDMQVTACETSGDQSFLHGAVGDAEWVVRAAGMLRLGAGEQVRLAARRQDVVRFG